MASVDPIVHDLEIMQHAPNYTAWIYDQIKGGLGQRIIECGAGIGNVTTLLGRREVIVALDVYEPCVAKLRQRFAGEPHVVPMLMDVASQNMLELAHYRPDAIVCINVLEHVEDDRATLRNMITLLQPGGRLALLVPAFQFLHGSIDRIIGHYRRYSRRELREKLTEAGFVIDDLFYMNCIAPAGWFLNNRILKRTQESVAQVKLFDRAFVPWLSRAERVVRPPFGLSLIALARRPPGAPDKRS